MATETAAKCPNCALALRPLTHAGVKLDVCLECQGVWLDAGEFEQVVDAKAGIRDRLSSVWTMGKRRCPRSHGWLRQQEVDAGILVLIDLCAECGGLWLDRYELLRLQSLSKGTSEGRWRVEALEQRVEEAHRHWDQERIGGVEAKSKISIPSYLINLLGLPVEVYHPVRSKPRATYALLALNVVIFVMQTLSPDGFVSELGLIPAVLVQGGAPWTAVTSLFLHGNIVHLIGNMYFLAIFGDNVEDRLGSRQFLVLYLIGGLVANFVHVASNVASDIPVIGASGAVSAVLGAYLYFFPQRRLHMTFSFIPLRIRTLWYLGIYLVLQFAFASLGAEGIAWWAHIGGFGLGIAWAAVARHRIHQHISALDAAFGK